VDLANPSDIYTVEADLGLSDLLCNQESTMAVRSTTLTIVTYLNTRIAAPSEVPIRVGHDKILSERNLVRCVTE
jgi:hypothetical protein